ncbi:hypothetical protein LX87_01768 [Larkinella arboricola]|uniref:Uncharacterized protein n=1 Tax=Larkinella arboricola TaxID=643671 RepID=A0A327X1S3_LARAB|nr:hypothetical protein [Larkinella arboricola]RAK00070.1 hypothetical protein LX87_01768 [Larkinella arboricola]
MKNYILPNRRLGKAAYSKNSILLSAFFLALSSCETAKIVNPATTDFDGMYAVQETRPEDNYLLVLHKKADKPNTITLENLANLVKSPLEARTSGNRLFIAEQAFTNNLGAQYTISGDGKIIDNVLTLHYTIKGYNGYSGAVYAKKQAGGTNQMSGQ